MIKRSLLLLGVLALAGANAAVLSSETPARADYCFGGCSMQVPTGGGTNCSLQYVPHVGHVWVCSGGGSVTVSTNCVQMGPDGTGAPCACPYEGQGHPISNGCPDPRP
jgi:hypothetical protein